MANIFITGGTGFLGSNIIKELLDNTDDKIYVLVRGKDLKHAKKKLDMVSVELFDPDVTGKDGGARINIVLGDITRSRFGLGKDQYRELVSVIDVIYSNAALAILTPPMAEARKVNVKGTKNVLEFAYECSRNGRLKKAHHISTAYVAGKARGKIKEDHLTGEYGFNNNYEKSKYEAELVVDEYRAKGLDIDIFRPGIVLGRSTDGRTTNFKMFYQPLHFFSMGLYDGIPGRPDSNANMITIDKTARAIFLISTTSDKNNMNYHITSDDTPDLETVLTISSEYFGFKKPAFHEPSDFDIKKEYTSVQAKLIEPFLPYFDYHARFDNSNTVKALEGLDCELPCIGKEIFHNLYGFCARHGFIKRKGEHAVKG